MRQKVRGEFKAKSAELQAMKSKHESSNPVMNYHEYVQKTTDYLVALKKYDDDLGVRDNLAVETYNVGFCFCCH